MRKLLIAAIMLGLTVTTTRPVVAAQQSHSSVCAADLAEVEYWSAEYARLVEVGGTSWDDEYILDNAFNNIMIASEIMGMDEC